MTPRIAPLFGRPVRRSVLCLGLAGLLLPGPAGAQAATAPPVDQAAAVDALVRKTMDARHMPGVSIAVIKDGKVVIAKGYGLSDVEKGIKATEQTVYQLASVTKQFTSMATLMLVDEGKLSLDARLTTILPGLPAAWAPVTVRHLLNHTSGIKSYTDLFDSLKVADSRVFTHDEILGLVKDAPLQFTPGDRFAYSNTGFFLLGMVIEKVSGKPYGTFVADRIFKPLGMTATALDDYADARPQRAKGYASDDGKVHPAEHTHPSQPFSAGALVSTVVDLAKWDAALSARRFLKPATYDAMWTPARLNDGKLSTYGFGWTVRTYGGHAQLSHGGGITGFSTFLVRFPDDKLTIIVLVNQQGDGAGTLAIGIAGIYLPGLEDAGPKPIADADATLLPDRVKQGPQMMGRHGALTAFDLLEESTRDTRRVGVSSDN